MKKNMFYLIAIAASMMVAVSCSKDNGSDNPEKPGTVSVTGVSLNKTATSLTVGGTETLTATVAPADAANKNVTWSSSANGVATVDASGKVTAVSPGTATITVSTQDGGKTAACSVTVIAAVVAVTSVSLNKTSLTLTAGDTETLTATVAPDNAPNKTVTWASSAAGVASVDAAGKVTAVSEGTATITVTTQDGDKTATCTVTVNAKPVTPTTLEVTITGTISHTTFTKGQSGTVTFNRFPSSVAEFKQVRDKIGGEPHGAVALQLMAYEMFRRDRNVGEECIRLTNVNVNVTQALNRLKELFGNQANYVRPYQVAAYLKGATPENGYNPPKPYTIEVKVNDGRPYDNSSTFQTNVIYLNVLTQGKDSGSDIVEVLKTLKPGEPGEGKFFIVFNSPGLYSQVKAVSFANPFKGLD